MVRNEYEDPVSRFGIMRSVLEYSRLGVYDPDYTIDDGEGGTIEADEILSNVYVINDETSIPRITSENLNDNDRISDRYIEDGSYLRVKNIMLAYNVPKNYTTKAGITNLRVYVNIQNMWTFTKYTGLDPEIGASQTNDNVFGLDNGRYPAARAFTFGLNISF